MHVRRTITAAAVSSLFALCACEPPPAAAPEDATAASAEPAPAAAEPGLKDPAPTEGAVDQANLPPAEQVLESAVAAVGGRERIASIKTYYKEERADIPAQNMSAVSKYWWRGGDLYAEVEVPGVGLIKMWKNGEDSWSEDPVNGLRKLDGKEAEQNERSASLVLAADWQNYFSKAETVARRKIGDAVVVDVKLTADDGNEIVLSIDEKTGITLEQSFQQETAMGKMPIVVRIDEWKDYDGFKEATVTTTDMKLMQVTTTVTKFEVNPEIDDSKFTPPGADGGKGKGKAGKGAAKKKVAK